MPTISRLIAAVLFAAIAVLAAEAFKLRMNEGTQFGRFTLLCAAIGLLCGWYIMGRLTGQGYRRAFGTGVRTSVGFVVWALLVCSILLMVRKAFNKRYDSPMEAVVDIFAMALENGMRLFTPFTADLPVLLGVLLLGGGLGGLMAEWAKRRWE